MGATSHGPMGFRILVRALLPSLRLPKHRNLKAKLQLSYYWPVVGLFNFAFLGHTGGYPKAKR